MGGVDPWLDEEKLLPGDDWDARIREAVRASDVVLVALSRASISREGYIQKELRQALDVADEKPEGTIFLIPIRLEECAVPDRLRRWQWLDFLQEGAIGTLLRALQLRALTLGIDLPPTNPFADAVDVRADSRSPEPSVGAAKSNPRAGMEYVWVPPGEFLMGAVPGDRFARTSEGPQHRVRLSVGFWVGRTPVTVRAYARFGKETRTAMPEPVYEDSYWLRENHPIINVTWENARAYCIWAGGQLPTEAQWEYAARGRQENLPYATGQDISRQKARYARDERSPGMPIVFTYGTSRVAEFEPNGYGLYDVSGNVSEWVADWFHERYYASTPADTTVVDPQGPEAPTGKRVIRGGSWADEPESLRLSSRAYKDPVLFSDRIGFRCILRSLP